MEIKIPLIVCGKCSDKFHLFGTYDPNTYEEVCQVCEESFYSEQMMINPPHKSEVDLKDLICTIMSMVT